MVDPILMVHSRLPARVPLASGLGALAAVTAVLASPSVAIAFDRPADPVVTTGAAVPSLLGSDPGRIVAFTWGRSGWKQIPVQVDQRKQVDLRAAYPASVDCAGKPLCSQPKSTGAQLRYADPATLIGADPDPALDADDELALMARDAGVRAPATAGPPARVTGSLRQELAVADPLDRTRAYAYLFRSGGRLSPAAGRSYLSYRFQPTGGSFSFSAGPNPETSTVSTPYYRRAFSDRWRESGAWITGGGATGVNVLDRNEAQFAPDFCGRTTLTFARGEGAFLVNRSGPVRAIRSVVGANSGPMSERQHVFYDRRTDETTTLRVHPIPGIMSFWDYSRAASGMRYANSNNPAGVIVDGQPDAVAPGPLRWESMDGPQGAVTHVFDWDTTVAPAKITSFYRDDAARKPCEGDADGGFHGASGPWFNGAVGATDGDRPSERLVARRTTFFDAPGRSRGAVRDRAARAPLAVSSRARRPVAGRARLIRKRISSNGTLRLTVRVNGPGKVGATVRAKGRRRASSRLVRARAAGTVKLTLRLDRAGRRLARTRAGLPVRLELRFRPTAAKLVSARRTLRLRF